MTNLQLLYSVLRETEDFDDVIYLWKLVIKSPLLLKSLKKISLMCKKIASTPYGKNLFERVGEKCKISFVSGLNSKGTYSEGLFSKDIFISDKSKEEDILTKLSENTLDIKNSDVRIAVVDYTRIINNPEGLKKLIDIAYNRRYTNDYDLSAPMRRRNS